jgi:cytosine/adenosine deaminase-related metal-dependent hydrolase
LPIATHLAESPEEAVFLARQSGSFRGIWEDLLRQWDEQVPKFTGGPIRFAQETGLLSREIAPVLAHVNYCDEQEMDLLANSRATVVYCPRTHAYFGHPPHPWRKMAQKGIRIAVGTDSTASSPNLNLVDDLRMIRKQTPDLPADEIWKLATVNGAAALGYSKKAGELAPGAYADMVMFESTGVDPLADILENNRPLVEVWFEGVRL